MNMDNVLEEEAKKILFQNMENSDMGIQIHIKGGHATLTGIVDVLSEKFFAERIIKDIPGIKKVENSLTISTDGKINDDDIISSIEQLIKEDRLTRISGIGINAKHGIVTLLGNASTLNQIHKAIELASSVIGVKEIINKVDLKVPSDIPIDDASIVNSIETVFAASGEVQSGDIKTICQKGGVYLEGEVDDPIEKEKATQLASTIPGVRKIVNNLTTRKGDNKKLH